MAAENAPNHVANPERDRQLENLNIRTYTPDDQAAVTRLYENGLLAGQIPPNDTGIDIENIQEAYLSDPTSHFWVAQLNGQIIAMIGVARDREHVAEVRRLRVDKDWQDTSLAALLIEHAISHCRQHDYLKVVLDTRFERDAAVHTFDRFGFQHTRTRSTPNKELLEFYLDLYRQPDDEING